MSNGSSSRRSLLPQHAAPTVSGVSKRPGDARINRTSKVAHKLKVLPEEPDSLAGKDGAKEESPESGESSEEDEEDDSAEVYKQISQIPAGTARKDARLLTKKEKAKLPRVTAYCTASSYRLSDLLKHLESRKSTHSTAPQLFDDVIYTPYLPPSISTAPSYPADADLLGDPSLVARKQSRYDRFQVDETRRVPEAFFFCEFGVTVLWGMDEAMERRVLSMLKRFELEKLAAEDVEMEELNFYYADYSRIYNDVIALLRGSSFMTKLALSYALAQSVKISLFEKLIGSTIEQTKDIPQDIAQSGKIGMPRKEIMKQIGSLFILRININLVGSVLDSPELFWTYPDLEPLYQAFRQYLEIRQRIDLLNTRVEVLQDLLKLLKESVYSRHSEGLETVVIWLIVVEILLGILTIVVDLTVS